ncbi:Tyrosine--tRNA ligase [bioreactor metagenome]|uniref:Tyrosine--tRNA ligase n=1 Tax=bioreactor metagenome TaxID=1076179 RepID=A0A645HZP2_9ZZZZ
MSTVPMVSISKDMINANILEILVQTEIVPSKAEGRRLIQQGGLTINEEKISDVNALFNENFLVDGSALVKRGKKKFYKLIVQ